MLARPRNGSVRPPPRKAVLSNGGRLAQNSVAQLGPQLLAGTWRIAWHVRARAGQSDPGQHVCLTNKRDIGATLMRGLRGTALI